MHAGLEHQHAPADDDTPAWLTEAAAVMAGSECEPCSEDTPSAVPEGISQDASQTPLDAIAQAMSALGAHDESDLSLGCSTVARSDSPCYRAEAALAAARDAIATPHATIEGPDHGLVFTWQLESEDDHSSDLSQVMPATLKHTSLQLTRPATDLRVPQPTSADLPPTCAHVVSPPPMSAESSVAGSMLSAPDESSFASSYDGDGRDTSGLAS